MRSCGRMRCGCSADRASAAKNDFVLTDRNVGAVGVLCRRLDGIPLAIELAAARVRSLSPEDLVARLDQRFKLLTRGSRAALERHQTLRSTIDWSYDLLDPIERRALNRLSVFAGGCDLAAAEAVLAGDDLDVVDVVDVLGQLVDKSLVVADTTTTAGCGTGCWRPSASTPRNDSQASGDTAVVRRRHADYYVELAEAAGPHLRSREQLEWARVVVRDTDNFRAALDWAVETPSPRARAAPGGPARRRKAGPAKSRWTGPRPRARSRAREDHPLFPEVAAWAAWGADHGRRFRAGRRAHRRRGASPSSTRYPASVRGAEPGAPRVLS